MNIEDNKIIAEFMGVFDKILSTGNIHSWSDSPFFYTTEDSKEKVMNNIAKYSKYHSDWNWLMGVVEKIESLEFVVTICYLLTEITNEDLGQRETPLKSEVITISNNNGGTKIQTTYNACVEFIKWHNKHNIK